MLKKNVSRSPTFDLENIKLHSSSYPHNFQNENEQITTRNGTELHSPTFGDGPQLSPILHLSSSNSPTLQPPRLSSRGRRSLTSVSSFEYLRWRRRRRVVAKKTLNWEFLANTIEVDVDSGRPNPEEENWNKQRGFSADPPRCHRPFYLLPDPTVHLQILCSSPEPIRPRRTFLYLLLVVLSRS